IHPRIGALDVLPFVPLVGVTMSEVVALAHDTGAVLAERHALPVYYYGQAARRPERHALRELRHGEYEGLGARLETDDGRPDDGPARFDARRGAALAGARTGLGGPERFHARARAGLLPRTRRALTASPRAERDGQRQPRAPGRAASVSPRQARSRPSAACGEQLQQVGRQIVELRAAGRPA